MAHHVLRRCLPPYRGKFEAKLLLEDGKCLPPVTSLNIFKYLIVRFAPASDLATGKRLASRAALGHIKAIERRHTESIGHHAYILFMAVKSGVATMSRPSQKPFDPKQIKPELENAAEALKDAKFATESGKGQINRGENMGDTADAHHTITHNEPVKKGP